MKWLKKKLVQRQVDIKLRKLGKRNTEFPEQIKSIGIIAASETDFEEAKAFLRNLWGYKVSISGYFFEEEESQSNSWISPKNFNLLGKHDAYLDSFINEKLDILLVPSLKLNPYLRYLLLANPTGFKLGFFSEENSPFLDLMLAQDSDDLKNNIQHLINYLNKIKETC